MNKRGISAVVATILIVLLSVVAVVIVWAVIKPALEGAAEQAAVNCIDVDVQVESCNSTSGMVKVKVNSGADLSKLRILLYDAEGNTIGTLDTVDAPVELGSNTYDVSRATFDGGTLADVTQANVGGIIPLNDEEDKVCPATATKVACSS